MAKSMTRGGILFLLFGIILFILPIVHGDIITIENSETFYAILCFLVGFILIFLGILWNLVKLRWKKKSEE